MDCRMYGRTKMEEAIDIAEVMFHPARLRKRDFYDQMLSTLTTEPMQDVDNSLSDAVRMHYCYKKIDCVDHFNKKNLKDV